MCRPGVREAALDARAWSFLPTQARSPAVSQVNREQDEQVHSHAITSKDSPGPSSAFFFFSSGLTPGTFFCLPPLPNLSSLFDQHV